MNVDQLIENAKSSKWSLSKLNFILLRYIPFNRPHGFKLIHISDNKIQVRIPYRKSNLNHLKGMHACCLATAAEYSSGFLILNRMGMKNYRIIMKSLEVEYMYQAKTEAIATFEISEDEFQSTILNPLKKEGVVFKKCKVQVHDRDKQLVCEAQTNWQIKAWDKVKTKVN